VNSPPSHRVTARNGATRSDNRIHADAEARAHGFRGGLVPGITTFGYMTRPTIEAFGLAWLDRGHASIRLRKPVYEGDALEVHGTFAAAEEGNTAIAWTVTGEHEIKATGTVTLLGAPPPQADLSVFQAAPLPATPPPVSREVLAAAGALGSLEMRFGPGISAAEVDDDAAPYREAGVAHPALLLGAANMILASNVALGPWIHVSSEMWLSGRVRDGDDVSVRGRIRRLFERNGRELVELSVVIVTNDREAVARIEHTAIYRL
jgi:acyl dehydratase